LEEKVMTMNNQTNENIATMNKETANNIAKGNVKISILEGTTL
jgi:hypothetical protein